MNHQTPPLINVPLDLSDEAAAKMLAFLHDLTHLFENYYADQLQRYHNRADERQPDLWSENRPAVLNRHRKRELPGSRLRCSPNMRGFTQPLTCRDGRCPAGGQRPWRSVPRGRIGVRWRRRRRDDGLDPGHKLRLRRRHEHASPTSASRAGAATRSSSGPTRCAAAAPNFVVICRTRSARCCSSPCSSPRSSPCSTPCSRPRRSPSSTPSARPSANHARVARLMFSPIRERKYVPSMSTSSSTNPSRRARRATAHKPATLSIG